jgi:CheY-like chemotaxis protein
MVGAPRETRNITAGRAAEFALGTFSRNTLPIAVSRADSTSFDSRSKIHTAFNFSVSRLSLYWELLMSANGKSGPQSSLPGVAPIKRRILLVEHDPAVLLTVKAVLEMNDFEVDAVSSARQALEKMESSLYHMVITEAGMDNQTAGVEVVREARRQPYDPAIALLTTDPPPDGHWHQEHTVLIKPIGTQDLLRQIEALLIRHEDEKRLRRPPLQLLKKPASKFKGERRRKLS